MPLLAILVLLAGFSAAPAAVLTSISIDGDMSDWAPVLADPFQFAEDGPAGGLVDLDAPVQSTGRDLTGSGWTYDSTYFYMYARRDASVSNQQLFWFYIDVNGDGLLATGEPVIGISWKGSNRDTVTTHYRYVAVAGAGDPIGDAMGLADGYTMPGTVQFVVELEKIKGGASDGVQMEGRVPWSVLGVPPGSAMKFHVSSSNSSNIPWQIDDNMGGPGGTVGTTDPLPAMTLVKSVNRATAAPGDVLTYTVVYTSTGDADAHNVVVADAVPPQTDYIAGSASGPGALIEFSHDGGASFDGSEALPVTHIRWTFPTPLIPGTSGSVSFGATVR